METNQITPTYHIPTSCRSETKQLRLCKMTRKSKSCHSRFPHTLWSSYECFFHCQSEDYLSYRIVIEVIPIVLAITILNE